MAAGIFARGGSKGIPGKNLRLLAGKPLVAHAVEIAMQVQGVDRIFVSTDSPEIAAVAERFGAEVPFIRPSELAGDDSPEWLAWRHAITELNSTSDRPMDVLLSIPPTSPLRAPADVSACLAKLNESGADLVVTVTHATHNPYFNMIVIDEEGNARPFSDTGSTITRRQDAPPVFGLTTVAYAARSEYVLAADSMFQGKVQAVYVPVDRALDVDSEFELRIAETLFEDKRPGVSESPAT